MAILSGVVHLGNTILVAAQDFSWTNLVISPEFFSACGTADYEHINGEGRTEWIPGLRYDIQMW